MGGGFIFEWGIRPMGGAASVLMEGGLKKITELGEGAPPLLWEPLQIESTINSKKYLVKE